MCEILRKESRVPIIMLTALDDDDSQMKGFDALADDYITKPFSMPIVMKHIEAVLRRAEQGGAAPNNVIRYKEITVDTDSLTVLVGTESVSLTTREFEILKLLLENQGRVCPGKGCWTRFGATTILAMKNRKHPHQEYPQEAGCGLHRNHERGGI